MQQVELKEWKNGLLREILLVVPAEGTWEEAQARLEAALEEKKSSLVGRNPQLTVHFGTRPLALSELEDFVLWLRGRHSLLTVGLVATDLATQEAAKKLALNTYLMLPGSSTEDAEIDAGNNSLYVPHTVRSGQRVVHGGHLVIAGDVNAGGEVIAEGDIIVFGTLRGLAHAGSQGDERARILAGNMRPQQIRIASRIARAPEDAEPLKPGQRLSEVARIENGEIQVFPA